MLESLHRRIALLKEVIFQVILHLTVFVFYAIDRRSPHVEEYEVVYFINLSLIAFLINYYLLPRFLYRKKYLAFLVSLLAIIVIAILMEELVLEQIYFPNTRGASFPGVFYTLLGILPVTVILVGFKFGWDALTKQNEVERLQAAINESELEFLKSQINPHFLFNNMNNLYAHAIENSSKTPEIILQLSSVLRYMLYDCKAKYVPLDKEVEQLKSYVDLNELQIEERGVVSFKSDIKGNYQIAPLILSVFVENAFKHSTASQSEKIKIDVNIDVTDKGTLRFSCINSFNEQSNTQSLSQGIGLDNVKKRLQLIYSGSHQLNILKQDDQYEVVLIIQLGNVHGY